MFRLRHTILSFIYLLLLCSAPLFSQRLPFDVYGIKDGLPSKWITTIFQDSGGYLWVGGDGGLAVYDGIRFQNYEVTHGLPVGHVWCITESRKSPGTMLIGTHGGGLTKFKDGEFNSIRLSERFPPNVVASLLEDHEGVIWCGTVNGVYRVQGDSASYFPTSGDSLQWVPFIYQRQDSLIWISHAKQLFEYAPKKQDLRKVDLGTEHQNLTCILQDDDGVIWLGSEDGDIFEVREDRIIAQRHLPHGGLRAVIDDREDGLWFTSGEGLIKIDKADFPKSEPIVYTEENGMTDPEVSPAYIDRENNLWFGSRVGGLMKLTDRNFLSIPIDRAGWMHSHIAAAVTDRNHLFVGSGVGLWEFWRSESGLWRSYLHDLRELNLPDKLRGIALDLDGRIWIALLAGDVYGYRMTPHEAQPTHLQLVKVLKIGVDLHAGGHFATMTIDHRNHLWYSRSDGQGVAQYDLNTMQLKQMFTKESGLPVGTISAILIDRDDNVWLGEFRGGLAVFKPEGNRYVLERLFKPEDGLGGDQVRSLLQHPNGEIWIGHRYDGISIYKDGKFEYITTRDGLQNNAVWALASDEKGRVWLGTSVGMQCIYPDEGRSIWGHRRLVGNSYRTVAAIPKEGLILGVSEDELTLFEPEKSRLSPVPTPVTIKSLCINGKEIEDSGPIEIAYGENLYEIDFFGISLKDEKALRFEYRLTGREIDWHGTTAQRVVQFTSLRPGTYEFEVRAVNSDHLASLQPARLSFTILPPIWQRWWFLSTGLLLVGAGLYGLHRVRLRRALEIERIRSRIATDLHDDIGAGLTHIGLLSEVTLRKSGVLEKTGERDTNGAVKELAGSMERVGSIARELSTAMSDVVWSINPKHDSVEALQHRLTAFAHEVCQAKNMELQIDVEPQIGKMPLNPEVRRNLLLIAKEAIHNVAKYAESPSVAVAIDTDGIDLRLVVEDHGKGFDPEQSQTGNGLTNMRSRAEKVGGKFSLNTSVGRGTKVVATVPHKS